MLYRIVGIALLSLATTYTTHAQNPRMGDGGGPKLWLAIPMIGAGTYADPKRPAFLREAGLPFRMQLSDDGATALVEVSGRIPADLSRLEARAKADSRSRIFRSGKDSLIDAVTEFRKYKKDFDPDSFARPKSN